MDRDGLQGSSGSSSRGKPAQKGAGVDTSDESDPTGELWTTGQVATYLADLGISRKTVSQMINRGELAGLRRGPQKWARVPAAVARAYRRQILEQNPGTDRPHHGDAV